MKLNRIHIQNFRGIENQVIENIQDALILIGKNNSGKSAILTALRTFWGDYSPEEKDFYKNSEDFLIEVSFKCSYQYLSTLFYDNKVGFIKTPSSASEYGTAKEGTQWSENTFSEFKAARIEIQNSDQFYRISTRELYEPIWMNAVSAKLYIQDDIVTVTLRCNKCDCKVQYEINNQPIKDIVNFLPQIAFIDDTRNFSDEETGKAKTLTSSIFNMILKNELIQKDGSLSCKDCNYDNCEENCINEIIEKPVNSLTINELEKIINYKTKNSSQNITDSISECFESNYQSNFRVKIKATSNIDKSFSIATKIYDPILESEISLSNVGAGVRSIYVLSLLQSYQAMCDKNALFIIEEPELYLHPELQKSMARTLWKLSNNNQVIFTTHSPLMLNEFTNEDTRKVRMNFDEYQTIVETTTLDAILSEIGYSSQDILNTDFVLFVEGIDDLEFISKVIQKYYDIDMNRISVIDTKSCKNIEVYATLRFLKKTTMSGDFAIIRDADTMEHEALRTRISNQMSENIPGEYLPTVLSHIYITKYSSIEGFLIDFDLLIQNRAFASMERLLLNLQRNLSRNKERHKSYFTEKNSISQERIETFENVYDEKIQAPQPNIDWIKENIRGHDLFGYVNGGKISIDTYVQELPLVAFNDFISFLDTIDFFRERKKPI